MTKIKSERIDLNDKEYVEVLLLKNNNNFVVEEHNSSTKGKKDFLTTRISMKEFENLADAEKSFNEIAKSRK